MFPDFAGHFEETKKYFDFPGPLYFFQVFPDIPVLWESCTTDFV